MIKISGFWQKAALAIVMINLAYSAELFAKFEAGKDPLISNVIGNVQDLNLKNCILQNTQPTDRVSDLTSLSCINEGITSISGIGTFKSITSLVLSNNSITNLSPLASLEISSLNISNNPIGNFNGLGRKPALKSLDISGTNIQNLSFLQTSRNVSSLKINNAFSLNSLNGIEYLNSLFHFELSNSQVDPISGLQPISALLGIQSMVLADNGIFDVQPIIDLVLSRWPFSNPNTSSSHSCGPDPVIQTTANQGESSKQSSSNSSCDPVPLPQVIYYDLSNELGVSCARVREVFSDPAVANWFYFAPQCMPSIPEFEELIIQANMEVLSVAWTPAIVAPAGLSGSVDHYVVQFDVEQGHGAFVGGPQEWPKEVVIDSSITSLDWSDQDIDLADQAVQVSIKACRGPNDCSPFSDPVYPEYPPAQPTDVSVVIDSSGTATVNWDYFSVIPYNPSTIEFELRPLFPIGSIPILVSPDGSTGLTVDDVSIYPGLLARLFACTTDISASRECGEPGLVSFRQQSVNTQIEPVRSLSANENDADNGGNDDGAIISWQYDDPDAYFRVTEKYNGLVKAKYIVGEGVSDQSLHQFTARRYSTNDDYEYAISACKLDESNVEQCSTEKSIEARKNFAANMSRPIAPIGTASEPSNRVCWFQDPTFSNSIRLRWSYDWSEGIVQSQYLPADTPTYFSASICNTFGCGSAASVKHTIPFHQSKRVFHQDEAHWYWESERLPKTTQGQPSRFAIIPDVDDRFTRNFGIVEITAVTNNNGVLEDNEATRCGAVPEDAGRSGDGIPGGPDDLKPGHWHIDEQPRQGWRFFWANELRLDEHLGSFGTVYDLIGFWYTYKIIEGEWSPVWYYTRMELIEDPNTDGPGDYYFEGSLHYPQARGNDLLVGTVQVYLEDPDLPDSHPLSNDHQQAWIRLAVDHGDGVVQNETFSMNDWTLELPSSYQGINSSSHWNGIWTDTDNPLFNLVDGHLGMNNMFLAEWITGDEQSTAAHFFDNDGEPIWLIQFSSDFSSPADYNSQWGTNYSGLVSQNNMYVPYPGFDPFWDGSDLVLTGQETLDMNVHATGGLGRRFHATRSPDQDHLFGEYCSNLTLHLRNDSQAVRVATLWTTTSPQAGCHVFKDIRKTASLHHFGYEVLENDLCELSQGACELELDWFTDDYFPNARPVVLDASDNPMPLHQFCSNLSGSEEWDFAVYGQSCIWSSAVENYRFALIAGDAYGSLTEAPVLARSRVFSATNNPVTPNPDTPSGSAVDPGSPNAPNPGDFQVTVESSSIGATRGNFRVTETGAATYSIPIMTVPGSGGVVPDMSLQYHSEAGIGALGRGWSVGGLSTITRCGQTIESGDGQSTGIQFNEEDRFCLDGQRLILITAGADYGAHGTQYRAEVDHLARITAYDNDGVGGPDFFEVERKDGSITTYGANASTDASAEIQVPGSDAIFAWPVSRIEDSAGNYMEFVYLQPDPINSIEWYPLHVHYTGHSGRLGYPEQPPYARISFNYIDLPLNQQTFGYIAGAKSTKTKQLSTIDSIGEFGQHIRHYALEYTLDWYDRNLLSSVKECWDNSSPNHCFEPTMFEWNDAMIRPTYASGFSGIELEGFRGGRLVDLDGDGLQDYLYTAHVPPTSTLRFQYLKANVNSFGTIQFGPIQFGGVMPVDRDDPPDWVLVDLNLDGFSDVAYMDDGRIYGHVWNPAQDRFTSRQFLGDIQQEPSYQNKRIFAADWDGDGKTDLLIGNRADRDNIINGLGSGIYFLKNSSNDAGVSFDAPQELSLELNLDTPYDNLPNCLGGTGSPNCDGGLPVYELIVSIVDDQVADFTGDGKVDFLVDISIRVCVFEPCFSRSDQSPGSSEKEGNTSGTDFEFVHFYALMVHSTDENDQPVLLIEDYIQGNTGSMFSDIEFVRTADFNADGISDILYVENDDEWFLRMGTANGLAPAVPQPALSFIRHNESEHLQFVPIRGDGTLDIIAVERASGRNNLRHFQWDWSLPGWVVPNQTTTEPGNLDENIRLFQDITGNGVVDTVRVRFDQGEWRLTSSGGNITFNTSLNGTYDYMGWFRINKIIDGFGAWTQLTYKSLAQPSVYTRGMGGEDLNYGLCSGGECSPVYDITYPTYVVSSASSLSPQHNSLTPSSSSGYDPMGQTRVDYYYSGARIQGGGRGFLGFSEVASYDPQSFMLTRTRYRQDFPFIGSPKATRSWYLNSTPFGTGNVAPTLPNWESPSTCASPAAAGVGAVLMGCSENTWAQRQTDAGRPLPYLQRSEEWSYVPDISGTVVSGSTFTHRVLTEHLAVDQFGNVEEVRVSTFTSPSGGSAFSSQHTVNAYVNHDDHRWHLGRLACATVESRRSDVPAGYPGAVTRISTFGYDDETGILDRETIATERCTDTSGALTTEYVLDRFGNRKETTITDDLTGNSRSTRVSFDSKGRFVNREEVLTPSGWRWTQQINPNDRDRYGNPLKVTSGNGISAWQYYDHMGRPFYSYSPDGAWSKTTYSTSSTDRNRCPYPNETALVEIYAEATTNDGNYANDIKQYVCKDKLGREVRTVTQGFSAGQWINIDTHYDYASRPIAVSEPYVDISQSATYCNLTDDATCLSRSEAFWTETFYDEFGRVMEVQLPNGRRDAIEYEGLTTTTVHGVGELGTQRNQTERNVLGDTIYERHWPNGGSNPADAAQTAFRYDALGQLVETDGPLPNGGTTYDVISIRYNALGQKEQVNDPDKGIWYYEHNAFGDLLCQIDAEGNSIASAYDALGRQIRRFDWENGSCAAHASASGYASKTNWTYSDSQGSVTFGQLTAETTINAAVAANGTMPKLPETTLTRNYDHDPLGRVWRVRTTIDDGSGSGSRPYTQETYYDEYGRVFQQFDATGGYRGERLVYNDQGYLQGIYDARFPIEGATPYRAVHAMNARGQVLDATLGNGTDIRRFFDPATGLPTIAAETLPNNDLALFYDYAWDVFNRLQNRIDLAAGLQDERYGYDAINRLTDYWITGNDGMERLQQQLRYDDSGNILCKSDVAGESDCQGPDTYRYGANGAGPHAVTEVDIAGGYRTFSYDANGNMILDQRQAFGGSLQTQRRFDYTPFNKLRRVTQENGMNRSSDFHYGPDRSRFLQRKIEGGRVVSRTHYIGNVEFEYEQESFMTAQIRRSVGGIAIEDLDISGRGKLRYQHKDHLGSIVALSTAGGNGSGGVIHARMGFDPWGQRRDPETIQNPWTQWVANGANANATFATPQWAWLMIEATPRGFTGHEHLDWHGLIHMNGRIYDPHLARFLQADPFMEDTGTLNRYSYVLNNPLIYTDPSGYFFDSFKDFFKTAISIAITVVAPQVWGFWGAVLAGAASGAIMTGSIEGALIGAFSGALFGGIGEYFGTAIHANSQFVELGWMSSASIISGTGLTAGQIAAQTIANSIASGVIAEMQGGKFGHGFISAGISGATTPGVMNHLEHPLNRAVAIAVVGGTASELTGGKFANGAVTSAMAFAFSNIGGYIENGKMDTLDKLALEASVNAYWRDKAGLSWLSKFEFDLMGIPYNPEHGFSATITNLPAPLKASAIVGFPGTASFSDWIANGGQAFFGYASQYHQATDLARFSSKAFRGNVMFAGHSLGGGLASAAAYEANAQAITFNAAGLHSSYRGGSHAGIRAHYIRGDWLTAMQQLTPLPNAAGTSIPHSGRGSALSRHGWHNF